MNLAGFFSCDITPERPAYLEGYAGRTEPSCGVADPLFLRIIALKDAAERLLIIATADLTSLPRSISETIYRWAEGELGISSERLILNVAHTHCAPILAGMFNEPTWKVDQDYVAQFVDSMKRGIRAAITDLQPAQISFGIAEIPFGINRRLPVPEGIAMRPNPHGLYNAAVPVFAFRRSGELCALLYSFSCHPTSRGGQWISADYPGAIARHLPVQYPCFAQGAAGSAKPRWFCNPDGTQFRAATSEELDREGRAAAEKILAFLNSGSMRPLELELPAVMRSVRLPLDMARGVPAETFKKILRDSGCFPYEKNAAEYFLAAMKNGTLPDACEVEMRVFGVAPGLCVIAISGEITAEAADLIVRKFPGEAVLVWGYTGYTAAYLPSASMLPDGGYEAFDSQQYYGMSAPFTPEIDALLGQTAEFCHEKIVHRD